jgi:hypothetical protein
MPRSSGEAFKTCSRARAAVTRARSVTEATLAAGRSRGGCGEVGGGLGALVDGRRLRDDGRARERNGLVALNRRPQAARGRQLARLVGHASRAEPPLTLPQHAGCRSPRRLLRQIAERACARNGGTETRQPSFIDGLVPQEPPYAVGPRPVVPRPIDAPIGGPVCATASAQCDSALGGGDSRVSSNRVASGTSTAVPRAAPFVDEQRVSLAG